MMLLDNLYIIEKGSKEYRFLKENMSKSARKKLGIKLPFFGKYRNKAIIPTVSYAFVIRFFMQVLSQPDLYLKDIIFE